MAKSEQSPDQKKLAAALAKLPPCFCSENHVTTAMKLISHGKLSLDMLDNYDSVGYLHFAEAILKVSSVEVWSLIVDRREHDPRLKSAISAIGMLAEGYREGMNAGGDPELQRDVFMVSVGAILLNYANEEA